MGTNAELDAQARRQAIGETQIPTTVLAQQCPWTVEQVLDDDFWPGRASPV